MTIRELLIILESLAPRGLAMSWDNVGLQVGSTDWSASKLLLSLDVTPSSIDYAIKNGYDLILSHHPFIYKPRLNITQPELLKLIEYRIGVIALHTNLDVVPAGVNNALAETLGLKVIGYLSHETGNTWYHCSVTVPKDYLDKVRIAIRNAGAGRIGFYDSCSTAHRITGTFRALAESNPFLGEKGQIEYVEEIELEFMVDSFYLEDVKQALISAHPYETPAVYWVKVENMNPAYGLGLVTELESETTLEKFVLQVKERLKTPFVQLWTADKQPQTLIKRVAICGGAGGSLISQAIGKADVFLTGDLSYHAIIDSRIPLINAGHFYTEYPVLTKLHSYLTEKGIVAEVFPITLAEYSQKNFYY